MPLAIPNTTVLSQSYTDPLTFAGTDILATGYFTVANNPVFASLLHGIRGQARPGPDIYLPPGTYPVQGSERDPIAGIRFKAATPNTPAPQVFGTLFYPQEASVLAGNPFSATVSPSGAVAAVLAYNEFTGVVTVNAATEATANQIVAAPSVTVDGATKITVTFSAPDVRVVGVEEVILCLFEDGASIGRLGHVKFQTGTVQADQPVFLRRQFTPLAGAHIYSVRGFNAAAAAATVRAGAGGSGVDMPGWIKVESTT